MEGGGMIKDDRVRWGEASHNGITEDRYGFLLHSITFYSTIITKDTAAVLWTATDE